jgi:hypothetical protein
MPRLQSVSFKKNIHLELTIFLEDKDNIVLYRSLHILFSLALIILLQKHKTLAFTCKTNGNMPNSPYTIQLGVEAL